MPDITMCSNTKCPMRHKCYRFTATPSKWQAYVDFDKYRIDDNCVYYIESEEQNEKNN